MADMTKWNIAEWVEADCFSRKFLLAYGNISARMTITTIVEQ
jgi:hypothetical protein